LAQNVPIAGRAFLEADWEIKGVPGDEKIKLIGKEEYKSQEKTQEMMKPNKASIFALPSESTVTSEIDSELEHYFPTSYTPKHPNQTAYLLIPLAPTPTDRLPLSATAPRHSAEELLPLRQLASIHTSHSTHSLRVSTLFARLDVGKVWDKGVSCDAYSAGSGHEGVCTVLRVSFSGWSAAEVRSVIGESGTGWCELYEVDNNNLSSSSSACGDDDELSETESGISDLSSLYGDEEHRAEGLIDPSQSFVLPTLDFSSSFLATPHSPAPSPALSRTSSHSFDMFAYPESDSFSDSDSSSDGGLSSTVSFHDSSSSGSAESWEQASWHGSSRFGFGFSSEFAGRLGSGSRMEDGPREVMF